MKISKATRILICGSIFGILVMNLGACTANLNSIYRTYKIPEDAEGSVALIDAKQRAILYRGSKFCAEPSPDAFTTLSSLIEASTGDSPEQEEAIAKLRHQINEDGINIGLRTQTITILRDMMYRLCERHMNDGIGKNEFSIQAARDQRLIASILAIEQLTGALRPGHTRVSAQTRDSSTEGQDRIEEQQSVRKQTPSVVDGPGFSATVKVAEIIERIVDKNFSVDEMQYFCIREVNSSDSNGNVRKLCKSYLNFKVAEFNARQADEEEREIASNEGKLQTRRKGWTDKQKKAYENWMPPLKLLDQNRDGRITCSEVSMQMRVFNHSLQQNDVIDPPVEMDGNKNESTLYLFMLDRDGDGQVCEASKG